MEGVVLSTRAVQPTERPQVFYVDGCKVTVRYSAEKTRQQSRISKIL